MRTKTLVRIGLALVIFAMWWILRIMVMPMGGMDVMTVQIPKGSSANDVARILCDRGIIRSSFGFRILARVTRKSTSLKPGAYRLSPSMSPAAVLDKVASGDVSARWVTFPEGYTIRRMGERLESAGAGDASRFVELASSRFSGTVPGFPLPDTGLEGYLFPDTYLVPIGESEEVVIGEMLACFERKVIKPLGAEIAASDLTLHQIVTLASLIEREARVPEERALISSVLRNRLRKNMRLECDATVLYALGEHKNRVLYRDLEVNSPYNTYRNAGLPPGPIANPGLASIEAALHPAQSDYLFYVARADGSHIFSRTFEEHQRARQTVRRRDNG